jgi:hypothetical protein
MDNDYVVWEHLARVYRPDGKDFSPDQSRMG